MGSEIGFEAIIQMLQRQIFAAENPSNLKWNGIDIKRISTVLKSAFNNNIQIPCSADALASAPPQQRTALVNTSLGHINKPCVISDKDNIALIYYLPNLLSYADQRVIFESTSSINSQLYKSIVPTAKKSSWRVAEENFVRVKGPIVTPGCINFSPGWLAQGHCGLEHPLKPSLSLSGGKDEEVAEIKSWLKQIEPLQWLSRDAHEWQVLTSTQSQPLPIIIIRRKGVI
ncbi:hypothetical protein EV360DRAFT_74314 [Lentinula raphanica]|nr:hypothetical protein EV360DRAFT_74314 [Lentinula raphanica]